MRCLFRPNCFSACHHRGVNVNVCRRVTNFTRCMGCDPADERFPTNKLYLEYYDSYSIGWYYDEYLTPLSLQTLCNISNQRTTVPSTLAK